MKQTPETLTLFDPTPYETPAQPRATLKGADTKRSATAVVNSAGRNANRAMTGAEPQVSWPQVSWPPVGKSDLKAHADDTLLQTRRDRAKARAIKRRYLADPIALEQMLEIERRITVLLGNHE